MNRNYRLLRLEQEEEEHARIALIKAQEEAEQRGIELAAEKAKLAEIAEQERLEVERIIEEERLEEERVEAERIALAERSVSRIRSIDHVYKTNVN